MKPLVSVIIPAKNEECNIKRLLQSVKKQTYKHIETIVVDDGSTDDTVIISRKLTPFVYVRKHAERSTQRNFGAKKAKGSYLFFLDADMELTSGVVEKCVELTRNTEAMAVTVAERTIGENFIAKVRNFERQMYMNDPTIEVPRFFSKSVFLEFKGYDPELTGPEDYDLPYRIGKKYKIARCGEYILHHEENLTLLKQLRKKYYYASKGASYAKKHPELVKTQGNLLFRKAYLRNWKKFIKNPILGIVFLFIRILEATAAVLGFINAVGIKEFIKTLWKALS